MKYKAVLISIVIVLGNEGCSGSRPSNKFGVPSSMERSILEWKAENDIDLSDDAFRLLVEQAGASCENCTEAYHFKSGSAQRPVDHSENESTVAGATKIEPGKTPAYGKGRAPTQPVTPPMGDLRRALHDYYLDQLRDINMEKGKKPVIHSSDIMAYSFTSFLRDLGFSDGTVGRLIVQSRPKTAFITINGKRKGYTNKRFVVETGRYRVKVDDPASRLSCDTTVAVSESETRIVICAPSGS